MSREGRPVEWYPHFRINMLLTAGKSEFRFLKPFRRDRRGPKLRGAMYLAIFIVKVLCLVVVPSVSRGHVQLAKRKQVVLEDLIRKLFSVRRDTFIVSAKKATRCPLSRTAGQN